MALDRVRSFEVAGFSEPAASGSLLADAGAPRSPRGGSRAWRDPAKAMSAETYKTILAAQGRTNTESFAVHGNDDDYTQEQLFLRQDFGQNKAVWVGDFKRDLWYYLINMNPILAACYSHPLHPISRKKRYFVYALSVVFVSDVASVVALSSLCKPCGFETSNTTQCQGRGYASLKCHELHDMYPDISHDRAHELEVEVLPWLCCHSYNFGALWLVDTYPHCGGIIYSTLANTIFSLACFQLMMCACVQQQSMRRRQIGERVGLWVFALLAVLTIYPFAYHVWHGKLLHLWCLKRMVRIFFSSKLLTWLAVTIFNVCLFCLLFWLQKPKPEDSRWRWLDAPDDRRMVDARPFWLRAVNARFHVLASEHQRVVGDASPQAPLASSLSLQNQRN